MADVYTRIGYIKGATGAQGERGLQGDPGDAATIQVGTVTTVPYGQTANVVNSGTESAAVFDFTIPQGRPGQETTDMQNLVLGSITTSAASFPIPAVGETGKVIFGKITKWFSDMSALVATKLNIDHVVNNLTTTNSGYALDARQGKALNDVFNQLIVMKSYSKQYTIPANGVAGITAAEFDVSTPAGYTPIGFRRVHPGNNVVVLSILNAWATGAAGMVVMQNVSATPLTTTCNVDIIYVKSSVFGTM